MKSNSAIYHKRFQALMVQQDLSSHRLAEVVNGLIKSYADLLLRITINPTQVAETTERIDRQEISIGTVIGYPLGNLNQEIKAVQLEAARQAGADHVDIVLPIEHLLDGKESQTTREVQELTAFCAELGLTASWVANLAFLDDEQRASAAAIIKQAGTPLVTNSGFNSQTHIEDLKTILAAHNSFPVTVCGGIESAEQAVSFLNAGAAVVASHNAPALLLGLTTLLEYSEASPCR